MADNLNRVSEALRPHGMRTGYHNHAVEFQPVEGAIPWEIVAANTSTDVILQLDPGFITSVGWDWREVFRATETIGDGEESP